MWVRNNPNVPQNEIADYNQIFHKYSLWVVTEVEVENVPTTGSSMGAAILDPPAWILVMFQLKIISF